MNQEERKYLGKIADKKGYNTVKRHIFLCVHGKCANEKISEALWSHLKKRLKEKEPDSSQATVARTKAGCLRICEGGTVALVLPEGVLYTGLTEKKIDRIVEEHLFGGRPVQEYIFHSRPYC